MSYSPHTYSPWSSSTSLSSILSQTPALSRRPTNTATSTTKPRPPKTFHHFLSLPLEIRRLILTHALTCPSPIDIHTVFSPLPSLLLTSHHLSTEATSVFFTTNTFRLLPTHPAATLSRAQPLLAYIQPSHLPLITSLELRLGPFWTSPPRCWAITPEFCERLSLMQRVRKLKVFVERDPSVEMYEGFRKSKGFYTEFCGELLEGVLGALLVRAGREGKRRVRGVLKSVVLDGVGAAVKKDGDLMVRLQSVVREKELEVVWGEGMQVDEKEEEREFIGTRAGVMVNTSVNVRMPTSWSLATAAAPAVDVASGSQGGLGSVEVATGSAMEDMEFSMATLDLAAQSMPLQGAQLVYPHA